MRAHRSQSYAGACAAAGENESGEGRARAGHVGGGTSCTRARSGRGSFALARALLAMVLNSATCP